MRFRPAVSLLLGPAVLALSLLLPGCASKNKGTNTVQVAEPFESGDMSNSGPTSVFVHTFPSAGSYSYRCRFHGSMTGAIDVVTGGLDSAAVSITNFAFSSASAIKPGGKVTWTNMGTTHSVTRP